MSTSVATRDPRVRSVDVSETTLTVTLRDGRTIAVPIAWFPKLKNATPADRAAWEPAAAGHGIHWPLIDEDLSVAGLLQGEPAPQD
jgi:Protein of unknown function (DUF2442)